jgi:hypothetical protein
MTEDSRRNRLPYPGQSTFAGLDGACIQPAKAFFKKLLVHRAFAKKLKGLPGLG